jgi:hypothetical protein
MKILKKVVNMSAVSAPSRSDRYFTGVKEALKDVRVSSIEECSSAAEELQCISDGRDDGVTFSSGRVQYLSKYIGCPFFQDDVENPEEDGYDICRQRALEMVAEKADRLRRFSLGGATSCNKLMEIDMPLSSLISLEESEITFLSEKSSLLALKRLKRIAGVFVTFSEATFAKMRLCVESPIGLKNLMGRNSCSDLMKIEDDVLKSMMTRSSIWALVLGQGVTLEQVEEMDRDVFAMINRAPRSVTRMINACKGAGKSFTDFFDIEPEGQMKMLQKSVLVKNRIRRESFAEIAASL